MKLFCILSYTDFNFFVKMDKIRKDAITIRRFFIMQNERRHISETTLYGLELSLLFLILCGVAVQVVFGQHHMFFLLLRLVYAPGMLFLAGLCASQESGSVPVLLKHAVFYAVLFLFF